MYTKKYIYYRGNENRASYRGLRYIEDRYIEVPLYVTVTQYFLILRQEEKGHLLFKIFVVSVIFNFLMS